MFLKISFDESSRNLNKTKFINYRTDTIIITVIYYSARDLRSVGRDRIPVVTRKKNLIATENGSLFRNKSRLQPTTGRDPEKNPIAARHRSRPEFSTEATKFYWLEELNLNESRIFLNGYMRTCFSCVPILYVRYKSFNHSNRIFGGKNYDSINWTALVRFYFYNDTKHLVSRTRPVVGRDLSRIKVPNTNL